MNSSDTLGQDRHSSFASASFPPKFSHEIAQVSFPVGPLRVSSEDADPGGLQFRPRLILITTNWRVWVGKLPVSAHTLPLNTHCVFPSGEAMSPVQTHIIRHVLSEPFICSHKIVRISIRFTLIAGMFH